MSLSTAAGAQSGVQQLQDLEPSAGEFEAAVIDIFIFGFPSPSEKNPRRRLDADIRRADGWRA